MRHAGWLLVCGALIAGTPAIAGEAAVSFIAPERFTDASLRGGYGEKARAYALDGIARHLQGLAARELTPAQSLAVEVLDVDLAGRFDPRQIQNHDLRILTEATWPRITLRYTLTDSGRVVLSAEETVIDQSYLARPTRASSDPLRYEKTMLDDWFRTRFVTRRAPPA